MPLNARVFFPFSLWRFTFYAYDGSGLSRFHGHIGCMLRVLSVASRKDECTFREEHLKDLIYFGFWVGMSTGYFCPSYGCCCTWRVEKWPKIGWPIGRDFLTYCKTPEIGPSIASHILWQWSQIALKARLLCASPRYCSPRKRHKEDVTFGLLAPWW